MAGIFNAAIFNNAIFNTGTVAAEVAPAQPNLPGGGGQGMWRWRSAMQARAARRKREETELAMILQAVMPLLNRGIDSPQEITLSNLGERDG